MIYLSPDTLETAMKYNTLAHRFLCVLACDRKPSLTNMLSDRDWDSQYNAGNINAIGQILESEGYISRYDARDASFITPEGWDYIWNYSNAAWTMIDKLDPTVAY